MIKESFRYMLYTLAVLICTLVAIPFVLIGELFYLLLSVFGVLVGIPFGAVKLTCKPLSNTMYLRLQSLENAFIGKLNKMNEFKSDNEVTEEEGVNNVE